MVERRFTPETEALEQYRKTGVVIFTLNREGKILVTQEEVTHQTDGGLTGELSVTCETGVPGEHWSETVLRGLKEELGEKVLEASPFSIEPNNCFIGESVFGPGVLARVIFLHYIEDPEKILNASGDGEVKVIGWMTPEEFLARQLRPGVRKILRECIAKGEFSRRFPPQGLVPLSLDLLKSVDSGPN